MNQITADPDTGRDAVTPLVSLTVLLVMVGMIAFTIGTLKYQPLLGTPGAAKGMETADGSRHGL